MRGSIRGGAAMCVIILCSRCLMGVWYLALPTGAQRERCCTKECQFLENTIS